MIHTNSKLLIPRTNSINDHVTLSEQVKNVYDLQ